MIVVHLQDDPLATMDAHVLLWFVYKEWPLLELSMNTKRTVMNFKKKLQQMNVGYIHRTAPDNHDWILWKDYTVEGLFNITSPPDKQDLMHQTSGL